MDKLIETLKFKTLTESDKVIVEGDLVSDGTWVANSIWLLNLPKIRSLGLISLINRVAKEKVALVKARLEGIEKPKTFIETFYSNIKLKDYREVSREKLVSHVGYPTGKFDKKGLTHLSFNTKNSPNICHSYAACLFFDLSTRVFIAKDLSPILLVNSKNEIVFAVAPLNPKFLKGVED